MNLTFKGFLRGYCRELTGLKTDNLKKLCASAASEQPAAAEAVMLFAAASGKAEYLRSLAGGTWLAEGYGEAVEAMKDFDTVEEWLASGKAPSRYGKAWNAYQAKRKAAENDRRVSLLMRDKTLDAMETAGVTAYALCKELELNLGNVYAYLNKGDATKVSKATARRLMECSLARLKI